MSISCICLLQVDSSLLEGSLLDLPRTAHKRYSALRVHEPHGQESNRPEVLQAIQAGCLLRLEVINKMP